MSNKTEAKTDKKDLCTELDKRQLNASLFGTNGRKQALVVLYTRSKPSKEVARAKGADLPEACAKAFAQLGKNKGKDESATEEGAGKDVF